jgi:8-oxo-dGTP pyrophosphatase MutT (NUDIX family)
MHRRPLLEMLDCYERLHPDESVVVQRIRALVERHADCFLRSCRPGHITGAAWILAPDRRRVLLTHHRKLDRWLQLGGHADGQFDVAEVALREAQEESGMTRFQFALVQGALLPLDIDVHLIPELRDPSGCLIDDAHEHHDIRFLLLTNADQEIRVSHESHDVRWFTPDEVTNAANERSVLRMLQKSRPWMA